VTSTAGDANGLSISYDSAQVGRRARIDDPVRQQQKQSATKLANVSANGVSAQCREIVDCTFGGQIFAKS
jgi:hypothetical protein